MDRGGREGSVGREGRGERVGQGGERSREPGLRVVDLLRDSCQWWTHMIEWEQRAGHVTGLTWMCREANRHPQLWFCTLWSGVAGSKEMRGLAAQEEELAECQKEMNENEATTGSYNPYSVYELPFQKQLNKVKCLSRVPMCPQYKEVKVPTLPFCRKKKKEKEEDTKL